VQSLEIQVDTGDREVVDITHKVAEFLRGCESNGLLQVFAPHATAGVALMETGSGSEQIWSTH